jgi:hypothetical protein
MKTFSRSILVSLLLIIAAPAYSETLQAIQVFRCEFNNEKTEAEDVLKLAAAWLKAAKQTPGGANMSLVIRFPIADGEGSESDFTWLISTPTFAEWGKFTDAYEGSAVAKVDDELFDNLADCGNSSMWEGILME